MITEQTRFGRLIVLNKEFKDAHRVWHYRVLCDCGTEKTIRGSYLTKGESKSCGCLHRELKETHGHSIGGQVSLTYSSWMSMKTRCLNENHKFFKHYGGRGVTVCDR